MKKIVFVGCKLPLDSDEIDNHSISSNISLLDADIIVFQPNIYISLNIVFKGKPYLDINKSHTIIEQLEHWKREIDEAIIHGKTIFIILSEFKECYIHVKESIVIDSNTTKIYDNYKFLSNKFNIINSQGNNIKLCHQNGDIISLYWNEFEKYSNYDLIIDVENFKPILLTKSGNKTVGAIYQDKNSLGSIILLPNINFENKDFFEYKDYNEYVIDEGKQFSKKFISAIIEIDKSLKSIDATPKPEWCNNEKYKFLETSKLEKEIIQVDDKIKILTNTKDELNEKLIKANQPQNLLFEKGHILEYAIIEALTILGFKAENYKDNHSEFDVVFYSEEGRFIGEAEGKDNKPINIDKFRQLSLNIQEDLAREEVDKLAKPVLFGNAYRLLPLEERDKLFTQKCIDSALSSNTALVFTPDLFKIIQYLSNNKNEKYRSECRKAIINGVGHIVFPPLPN